MARRHITFVAAFALAAALSWSAGSAKAQDQQGSASQPEQGAAEEPAPGADQAQGEAAESSDEGAPPDTSAPSGEADGEDAAAPEADVQESEFPDEPVPDPGASGREQEAGSSTARSACAPVVRAIHQGRVYVACEGGGVQILEPDGSGRLRMVGAVPTNVQVRDLQARGGEMWMTLASGEQVALSGPRGGDLAEPGPPTSTLTRNQTTRAGDVERPPGAAQEPAERESRIFRPRVPGWELGLVANGYAGDGLGTINEAWIGYRAEVPFFMRVQLDPMGYAANDDGDLAVFASAFLIGVDHQWFEIGVGTGTARVRIEDRAGERVANGFAPLVSLVARIGTRDGLHAKVTNSVAVVDGDPTWSNVAARLQVPLRDGFWLRFKGSGGEVTGHGQFGVGLRMRVKGEEDRDGAVYVTPTLGGTSVFNNLDFGQDPVSGFLIGIGVAYRP